MTDITINAYGKPLSMNPAAIRQRNKRARDRAGIKPVTQVTRPASPVTLDPSRRPNGTVLKFNGSHPRDIVTPVSNQHVNGVTHVPVTGRVTSPQTVLSPSLQPAQSPVSGSPPSRRRVTLGRVIVTVLAIMFSLGSIGTNATYLVGQGRSILDVGFLGLIAVTYELALVALPTYLGILWRERKFGWFLTAALGLTICFTAAIYAAAGFVNSNFGDTEAARASALRQHQALQADLDQARAEKSSLRFERATQAQVDAADRAVLKECWRKTDTEECRARRREHAGFLDRLTKTERADHLDQEIPRLQAALGRMPAAKSADPQVEAVVLMFSRMSRGALALDPRDVESGRLLTFMCLPLLAGLFFAFGDVLGERRR